MANAAPAVSKSRWIAGGLVLLAGVAVAAGLLSGHGTVVPQAAAQTPAPAPAVGVRLAPMKGFSRSFEFVGRIKAIE